MTIKKFCLAVFAGMMVLAAPAGFADDDDDDDDWKKRRHAERKKKGKHPVHYHHYYYIYPDGTIEGPVAKNGDAPLPPVPRERHAPYALQKPYPKSAPAFPRESPGERSLAKERQRSILEKELAAEQELLERARGALGDSFGDPERTQVLKDDVQLHERNIAALRRELSHLER